jgi:transposase
LLVKTYARKGQTPVLSAKLTRDHLSVISAITETGQLYTQMQDKAFDSAAICRFLEHLQRQIPGKLLIIWDGAPIHRSRVIKAYLAECEPGRVRLERLPGYAPELNPDEGIWRHLKQSLQNVCCTDLVHLRAELYKAIKRLRHKRHLIQACFQHAEGL